HGAAGSSVRAAEACIPVRDPRRSEYHARGAPQGVPLVAIPITNDQPGVAARILQSGTGLFVPLSQLRAESLYGLVDQVLANPSFRKRAHEMKAAIAAGDGLGLASEVNEKTFI